jgi:hypothetical protein
MGKRSCESKPFSRALACRALQIELGAQGGIEKGHILLLRRGEVEGRR